MPAGRDITTSYINGLIVSSSTLLDKAIRFANRFVEAARQFPYDDLVSLFGATTYVFRNEAVRRGLLTPSAHTTGTAQSGTSTTIVLENGAEATDDAYNNALIKIESGTGAGQIRRVSDYDGTNKTVTIATDGKNANYDKAWDTDPDNTSVYQIYPDTQDIITFYLAIETLDDNYNGTGTAAAGGIDDPKPEVMVGRHADLSN